MKKKKPSKKEITDALSRILWLAEAGYAEKHNKPSNKYDIFAAKEDLEYAKDILQQLGLT